MATKVACPQCKSPLSITTRMAGRKGKCPKCAAVFRVPENFGKSANAKRQAAQTKPMESVAAATANSKIAHKASASGSPTSSHKSPSERPKVIPAKDPKYRAQLLAAFTLPIDRVRKSIVYSLAVLMVTFVMILLPVCYVAFIGLVGFGVYYHVMINGWLMTMNMGARGRALMLIVYVAPIVVGAIAVLFMLKPLFARPSKKSRTRSLTRDGEPLLFEFVDHICEAVGSPEPSRIDVDCQMNASASFRSGTWSMLTGNDLVLTIGMPLAAGLSLRQFTGVLAHEFGHFSQGLGMRLSYVIRSVNRWFARVVYERDEWDDYLVEATSEIDFRIGWVLALAQVFVWFSRQILWVLMMTGHIISGLLLRQMEYDADRYEARLVGNRVFEETSNRLPMLGMFALQ